ncbi:hypothetical protein GCM10028857_22760 [Salinarchaeum chitinilyticum]
MLRRLAAAVAGIGLAAGLTVALGQLLAFRYALAIGAGIGTGVFLVVDGSAGAGEGWVYHEARPRSERFVDFQRTAGIATAIGLLVAWATTNTTVGRIGAAVIVVVATLIVANLVFLYRRPAYEDALEE